jgi:hypothetical protein
MVVGNLKRLVHDPTLAGGMDRRTRLEFFLFMLREVDKIFHGASWIDILTETEWIESRKWPEKKKEVLRKLRERGPDYWNVTREYIRDHLKEEVINCFVKSEAYGERKASRKIANVKPGNLINTGRLTEVVQSQIFDLRNVDGTKIFMKTVPQNEKADHMDQVFSAYPSGVLPEDCPIHCMYNDPPHKRPTTRIEEGDFSSWESSQGAPNQLIEVYIHILVAGVIWQASWDVLHAKYEERTWDMFYYTVKMPPIRLSGSVETSCMNGFNNYVFHKFMLKKIEAKHYAMVIEGDDIVVAYRGKWDLSPALFSRLGLGRTGMMVSRPNEATFCGLFFDEIDRAVIKDPWPVMVKTCWLSKQYLLAKEEVLLELQRAKALSLLCELGGCPILTTLALRIIELTNHISLERVIRRVKKTKMGQYDLDVILERISQLELLNKPLTYEAWPIGARSRQLMSDKFDVSVAEQLHAEEAIQQFIIGENIFEPVYNLTEWVEHAVQCSVLINLDTKQYPLSNQLSHWRTEMDQKRLRDSGTKAIHDKLAQVHQTY